MHFAFVFSLYIYISPSLSTIFFLFCSSLPGLFLLLFRCFFHYACLLAALVSVLSWLNYTWFLLMPAHPLSLPCLTPTTHFLGLRMDNSSLSNVVFPFHRNTHSYVCLVTPQSRKSSLYGQLACTVYVMSQALYGSG